MKEVYDLKNLIIERGCIEDADREFTLREVEKTELKDFLGLDPEEGFKQSIKISLEEGNIMYRALCKTTGDLMFVMGLTQSEIPGMGIPWMLSSINFKPSAEFIRASKEFIQKDIFEGDTKLISNYIHKDNTKAIKWLRWLGFTFIEHPYLSEYFQFYKHKE